MLTALVSLKISMLVKDCTSAGQAIDHRASFRNPEPETRGEAVLREAVKTLNWNGFCNLARADQLKG